MSTFAADLSGIEARAVLLLIAKATVVISAAGLLNLLLHRSAAAARYWCWFLGLGAMLAVAVMTMALPAWRVLPNQIGTSPRSHESISPLPASATATATASETRLVASTAAPAQNPARPERVVGANIHPISVSPSSTSRAATNIATPSAHPASRFRISWPITLLGIWLLGAALALLPTLIAGIRLRRIRRGCVHVCEEEWQSLLASACRELGLRRPVQLLQSREKRMPMVWGIFYPKLLVGADASDWPRQRRRAVLLHELAHLRRHDCLTDLLGRLICCIYWFHPLAWIALSQMRKLRELACDDLVLSSGQEPTRYAQHLLHIAAATPRARFAVGIQMARGPQLETRLLAILDPRKRRRPMTRRLALVSATCALALATPLAMLRAADPPPIAATNPVEQIDGDVTTFDGHPVKDAEVVLVERHFIIGARGPERLANDILARTRTDADGKFRLPSPAWQSEQRNRIIRVTAEGFAYGISGLTNRDGHVSYFDFLRQASTDRPSIILPPAARIIGTVVDGKGNPIASAQVVAAAGVDPLITDAAGRFVVEKASPSQFGVFYSHDMIGIRHPDFMEFESQPTDIVAGRDNPLRIVLDHGVLVQGTLSDADTAKPLKGFVVRVEPRGGERIWSYGYSDEQGHYQMRVPAGQVDLLPSPGGSNGVADSNYYPVVDVRSIRVSEDTAPPAIDFQFRHAQKISGKVVGVEAGALSALSLEAMPAGGETRGNNPNRHYARLNADGMFSISQIKPGRYELQVKRPASSTELVNQYVTVQAGQDISHLVLKIPPALAVDDAIEVRGTVRYADGSPAPNTRLDLVANGEPDIYALRIDKDTYASADGSFAFHFVRSSYKWTIWARDPSALQGAAMILDEADFHKPITLTLQNGMEFSGTVMDANGKGIAGYQVGIYDIVPYVTGESHRPRVVALTDEKGHYTLKGFVPPIGASALILNAYPTTRGNRVSLRTLGYRNLDVRPEARHDGFDFEVLQTGSSMEIRRKENK